MPKAAAPKPITDTACSGSSEKLVKTFIARLISFESV